MNRQANFLREQLNGFRAKRTNIMDNRELSLIGKDNALAQWKKTTAGQYQNFYTLLQSDVQALRERYSRNEKRRAEMEAKAADGWDYNRLAYHTSMIQAKHRATRSAAELEAEYQKALASGDRHLIRAYSELLPSLLPQSAHDDNDTMRRAGLLSAAKNELARVMAIPGMDKQEQDERELLQDARELVEAVNDACQFFEHDDAVTRGFLVSTGPLAQLLNGVDLNESFSPESGGFVTTLMITEPTEGNPNVVMRVKDGANTAG